MRILVTGATGLIGKNFIRAALKDGHEILALVRNPSLFKMLPEDHIFPWSHTDLVPPKALDQVEAVVHLAGENIADSRWTEQRKKRITESRLVGTKNLIESIRKKPADQRPKTLISGSAIGIYGYSKEGILDESAEHGNDFLAQLCVDWENQALDAQTLGLRVVIARTGIVLSKEGGALTKMPPVQIADGQNWMSWIHIHDMTQALLFCLKNKNMSGAFNCVAPNPVKNKELTKELAQIKGVPVLGIVPKFVLKTILGELAEVLFSNQNVVPDALIKAGYQFQFPFLKSALENQMQGHNLMDEVIFKDQFVSATPEDIFPFFEKAENLEILTPPWLNFKIVSKSTDEIKSGTEIVYKLNIHGVPVRWKTLIRDYQKNIYFTDEQVNGPYSKWHHLHTFERVHGGCLLRDEITYRVPLSILGKSILGKWIASDVNQIFSFRQKRIEDLVKSGKLKT